MDTLTAPQPIKKKRRPRIHHDPALAQPKPFHLMHRGTETLLFLDRHRFATARQIAEALFVSTIGPDGKPRSEAAARSVTNEKCLLRGKDLGLIERISVFHRHRDTGRFFMDAVNILTRKGAEMVAEEYDRRDRGEKLRWTPDLKKFQHASIDHELEIIDAAIALYRGVEQIGGEVRYFFDDDQLSRAKGQHRFQDFTPDAFALVLVNGYLSPLFFEIDRGTEVVRSQTGSKKDIKTKVERYGAYMRGRYPTDPFLASLRGPRDIWQSPVVLTITTSAERLANMLTATEEAGGRGAYWYTTRAQAYAEVGAITGPIWQIVGPEKRSLARRLAGPS